MLADKVAAHADELLDRGDLWHAVADIYHPAIVATVIMGGQGVKEPECQRFVFSPQIAELTAQLGASTKSMEALCKHVVLPDEFMWIEFPLQGTTLLGDGEADVFNPDTHPGMLPGGAEKVRGIMSPNHHTKLKKIGMFIAGIETEKDKPAIEAATVICYCETAEGYIGFNTAFEINFGSGHVSWKTSKGMFSTKDISSFAAFFVAACSVINTPRIFDRAQSELDRLNKARARNGKPPLLSYSEVTMPADTAEALKDAEFGVANVKENPEHKKGGRKRHRVRTFVRIIEGIVQIVRPHWRGDAKLGFAKSVTAVRHGGERTKHPGIKRVITR